MDGDVDDEGATTNTRPEVQWSPVCGNFNESAHRPICSISPNVRGLFGDVPSQYVFFKGLLPSSE